MGDINQLHTEYISRINKTLDYIEKHIKNQFTLEELALISHFSKFHFNRVFHSLMGESPFQFILRVRLEKAASLLKYNSNESITEISYQCGFSDLSVFSRNFKIHFHVSATHFRNQKSNLSQTDSNTQQGDNRPALYFCPELKTIKWRTNMKTNKSVEVKEFPKMTVAYLRHIGPYKGDAKLFEKLWGKICSWAGSRGLMNQPDLKFLIIYHDDPKVTIEEKLRMSVCITVPSGTKVDGEIGKMDIEKAKYVVARFEIDANGFMEAWDWIYGQWLPSSGYQPDDKPCFELYPEEPENGRFLVDICVPIKPL
jgi:AraC family transcriptional regulator